MKARHRRRWHAAQARASDRFEVKVYPAAFRPLYGGGWIVYLPHLGGTHAIVGYRGTYDVRVGTNEDWEGNETIVTRPYHHVILERFPLRKGTQLWSGTLPA